MRKLVVPAEDEQLDKLNSILEEELERCECPMKIQMQILLAFEEAYVNVAHYAYAPGTGEAEIDVDAQPDPAGITIVLRDRGTPFNPLTGKEADISLPAEERNIGGLGIFLIKKSMDEVEYSYTDGMNILKMTKKW